MAIRRVNWIIVPLIMCTAACRPDTAAPKSAVSETLAPLAVQQSRAYDETVTGLFVSLADFEDESAARGKDQAAWFSIPPGPDDSRNAPTSVPASSPESAPTSAAFDGNVSFVSNTTRTGIGALEVNLPPRRQLMFTIPKVHDFSGYTLLSFALHSPSVRDDLRVTLTSDRASWTSPRMLVQPGWNTVLVDIQRLSAVGDFDIRAVRTMSLAFGDALDSVNFCLDDLMLINNRREIHPTPAGVSLLKNGLDYKLDLSGHRRPIRFVQGPDGLWRAGDVQAIVQVLAPGDASTQQAERLDLLGDRRIGRLEILENNAIRLRVASSWYFPSRQGEWVSMAVRQIRWEYTFYGDGRCVTHVAINNSGGKEIGLVNIVHSPPVAWAGGEVRPAVQTQGLANGVGGWSFLQAPPDAQGAKAMDAYLQPGRLEPTLAADFHAPLDEDRNGFDRTQGCYVLAAKAGRCRFVFHPPPGGVVNPVFIVHGQWSAPVVVNVEGKLLTQVAMLNAGPNASAATPGGALFCIDGPVNRPIAVEVFGKE